MKNIILLCSFLIVTPLALAEHLGLDQLLREVKKTQGIEARINKSRESQFLADKNNSNIYYKQRLTH